MGGQSLRGPSEVCLGESPLCLLLGGTPRVPGCLDHQNGCRVWRISGKEKMAYEVQACGGQLYIRLSHTQRLVDFFMLNFFNQKYLILHQVVNQVHITQSVVEKGATQILHRTSSTKAHLVRSPDE